MAEWSNAAVLKTVVRSHVPGVRIPLSPQTILLPRHSRGIFILEWSNQACLRENMLK
jgi:hypothetical protein